MFRMDSNRRVAALAVIVVLSLGSPLAAAGWEMPVRWIGSGDLLKSFTSILAWLGGRPSAEGTPTCDHGMGIDPNGCPKSLDHGMGIDPNGTIPASVRRDSGFDLNGRP